MGHFKHSAATTAATPSSNKEKLEAAAPMRARRCLAIAAVLPVLIEARLHGLAHPNALVVVEKNAAALQDACSGDECFRRASQSEPQQQVASVPEFIPTHEWQEILPNQPIPPGLYIRVNLETGRKEAKLLD